MADSSLISQKRDPIKSSVGNLAAQRRRQNVVAVAKERRETLVRTKRLCRVGVGGDDGDEHMLDEDQSILETQTSSAVDELKAAIAYKGKGSQMKRVGALQQLRRLLSKSELPPVDVVLEAGAIPVLVQCLSFGSPDEQLLEAAWCLTNIAAGQPEETKSLLPALPLLIAHLGEKSSLPVAEQCAWALGNVAGEGQDLRTVLLAQGALLPLARMILPDKGTTATTAAWALSNLIKGPNPRAANELVKIDGVPDAIIRHLRKSDEELATEVAWVVVYLTALSNIASSLLVKRNLVHLLVDILETSKSLQLLIPMLRSLGNLVAGDPNVASEALGTGSEVTDKVISALVKCLGSEHRVLKKVLRGMPNGEGPKLVERLDGIEAMERFQFHENEDLRNMANGLVDKYFGEDYGLDDA